MDEDSSWSCSDLCCCECNYKAPTLHPHPTQSHQAQAETHAQARTPPRQLMEQISMLNHTGYMLQIVGPDGKVSVIDTHAGSHGPSSAVPTAKSTPVIAFQPSPMGSPQGHPSSPRLGDTGSDRFTRDHYERMLYDHRMVSNYGRKLSITGAQSPVRVLPPIPGSPGTSRGSSLFTNQSERQIRTVHPS